VSRNVSHKWKTCLQAAGGAQRRPGELGEGDLQGNSPMDTSFVLQVIVSHYSCAAWCHVSLTQRASSRKLQRTRRVRECIVATTVTNFAGFNPAVIWTFCEKIRILICVRQRMSCWRVSKCHASSTTLFWRVSR